MFASTVSGIQGSIISIESFRIAGQDARTREAVYVRVPELSYLACLVPPTTHKMHASYKSRLRTDDSETVMTSKCLSIAAA